MLPGVAPTYNTIIDVNTDRALIVGSGFDTWTYRSGFDLSIPFYNPALGGYTFEGAASNEARQHLLISSQFNLHARHLRVLMELAEDNREFLILQICSTATVTQADGHRKRDGEGAHSNSNDNNNKDIRCSSNLRYEYPDILSHGQFCLIARGVRLVQINLLESLASGCVPVIMADNIVMPFSEVGGLAVIVFILKNIYFSL